MKYTSPLLGPFEVNWCEQSKARNALDEGDSEGGLLHSRVRMLSPDVHAATQHLLHTSSLCPVGTITKSFKVDDQSTRSFINRSNAYAINELQLYALSVLWCTLPILTPFSINISGWPTINWPNETAQSL